MRDIKIETLSQIHIGNGSFLLKGNDYIADNDYFYVLNIDKLGSIIGKDPKTIQLWSDAIINGNASIFLKNRIQGYPIQDITKRRIKRIADFNTGQSTIKECMHDGIGKPYIPGSSIKGAIRTVVMSSLARKKIVQRLNKEKNIREWKKIIQGMENELLHFEAYARTGKRDTSPSSDYFRFLSTGDAFFDYGVEIAVSQINLNITEKEFLEDNKKQQIVEAIKPGVSSQFRLKIGEEFYRYSGIEDLQNLFKIINDHTYNLLCDEIDFWGRGEGSRYTGQDDYLDQLDLILDQIEACQPNECILRIGQASGWRFVTGAWLEEIDKQYFKKEIVPQCRPRNFNYVDYPFPKSRRIDSSSNVFGFVKLTVL